MEFKVKFHFHISKCRTLSDLALTQNIIWALFQIVVENVEREKNPPNQTYDHVASSINLWSQFILSCLNNWSLSTVVEPVWYITCTYIHSMYQCQMPRAGGSKANASSQMGWHYVPKVCGFQWNPRCSVLIESNINIWAEVCGAEGPAMVGYETGGTRPWLFTCLVHFTVFP